MPKKGSKCAQASEKLERKEQNKKKLSYDETTPPEVIRQICLEKQWEPLEKGTILVKQETLGLGFRDLIVEYFKPWEKMSRESRDVSHEQIVLDYFGEFVITKERYIIKKSDYL